MALPRLAPARLQLDSPARLATSDLLRLSVCVCVMLLVVLLSPKMLNAGNTYSIPSLPFSALLRAGFITLGVRKIKIVPLSQKHAQQYTHTHTQ